jgi:large subunit ribosomal protein L4
MSAVSFDVVNIVAEKVDTISLDLTGKTIDLNKAFVKDYLYKLRIKWRGENKFAHTKGISQVSGTTKKPYKQKGTGNARQGSLRAPQYRGGGIVFGPIAVKRKVNIQKSETALAKKMLLSFLIRSSRILVIDSIAIDSHKTKQIVNFATKSIEGFTAEKPLKTLLIASEDELNENIFLSTNNLFWFDIKTAKGLTVWAMLFNKRFVFTKKALLELFA